MSPYGSMWNDDGTLRKYPLDYVLVRNPLEDYYGADKLRIINSLFSNLYAELKLPFGFNYRISYQPRFNFVKIMNFIQLIHIQARLLILEDMVHVRIIMHLNGCWITY